MRRNRKLLLDAGSRLTITIRRKQRDPRRVAGGQQHAVGFLAANQGRLEIRDDHDQPTHQRIGRVMADASHDLLLDLADANRQKQQLVRVRMLCAAMTLAMRKSSFAKSAYVIVGFVSIRWLSSGVGCCNRNPAAFRDRLFDRRRGKPPHDRPAGGEMSNATRTVLLKAFASRDTVNWCNLQAVTFCARPNVGAEPARLSCHSWAQWRADPIRSCVVWLGIGCACLVTARATAEDKPTTARPLARRQIRRSRRSVYGLG